MEPSGGSDIMENLEYVVSFRAVGGRTSWSRLGSLLMGGRVSMVVGSAEPLSVRVGGSREVMMKQEGVKKASRRDADGATSRLRRAEFREETARMRPCSDQVSTRGL